MQTIDEVKKHCRVVGEGIALCKTMTAPDQLCRAKHQHQECFG